ncbi:hypothetical protein [Yinghuangia soli]|uniref:DUF4232 domain-containing protein n=1 Tax=Yinghuangia soli TaxID=2908204 RepID=A0AA41U4M3_9ACTN|nr:hypothetical protein [Yinghuangia soli]MCF2529169.1 hypothetical protein [Yinghuangia soli]
MTAMNEGSGVGGRLPQDGRPDAGGPAAPAELEALRRRLQDAVSGIQPAPDALERLRAAVPARRRRRRATVLTVAATVVVLAVATPMVRTVVITDQNAAKSGEANVFPTDGSDVPGGEDDGDDNEGSERVGAGANGNGAGSNGGRPPARSGSPSPGASSSALPGGLPNESPAPGQTAPVMPPVTTTATVGPTAVPTQLPPACTINDIEQGAGTGLAAAGPDGMAYGVVEVRNISRRDCSITGSGNVLVAAAPGNPPIQVSIKMHEAGDPAVRLPAVLPAGQPLVVPAGAAYEFQFAWLATPGPGVGGSCTPGDNPPGPPPPVPALGYMLADGGVKIAEVPLTAACGGVVYRTDVYLTGAYPRAS